MESFCDEDAVARVLDSAVALENLDSYTGGAVVVMWIAD